jgi:hypothetical protein
MVGSGSSCKLAMSNSAADENREVCEWLLMLSCRIGMSLVTGPTRSGVSLDCVLECAAELTANEDPDCRESRPPADVSSCSSILKEGIGCCAPPGTGFRRRELLDRDRLEPTGSGDAELAAFWGMGGSFLLGGGDAASDMAMCTVKIQPSARTYV